MRHVSQGFSDFFYYFGYYYRFPYFFLQAIQSFNFFVFLRIFHITLNNAIDFTQEQKKCTFRKPLRHVSHYLLKGRVFCKSRKIQDRHPWRAPC